MRSTRRWLALILIFGAGRAQGARATGPGFLNALDHPRTVAMGRAVSGLADDYSSAAQNPAALAMVVSKVGAFCYLQPSSGGHAGCMEYNHGLSSQGTIGLFAYYEDLGSFSLTTGDSKTQGSGRETRSVVIGRFGRDMGPSTSVGAFLKAFQQQVFDTRSIGAAADLGAVYRVPVQNLQIGASILNLGPGVREGKRNSQLPTQANVGLGYKLLRRDLPILAGDVALGLDGFVPIRSKPGLRLGLEYAWSSWSSWLATGPDGSAPSISNGYTLSFRGGSALSPDRTVYSTGAGLSLGIISVDYSFTLQNPVSAEHRLALGYKFGPPVRQTGPDILYSRRIEQDTTVREQLVQSTVEDTSMKFVEQALNQAGTLLGAVWELGAEQREPERFEEARRSFEEARTATQSKHYEDAWILASQASLKAIDLKEVLARPVVQPIPAAPEQIAEEPEPAEPPAPPHVQSPPPAVPKALPVRAVAPPREPVIVPEPEPASEPLISPEQSRRFEMGRRQYEEHQYSAAITTWEALLRELPGHSFTRLSLSRAYRYLGLESFRSRNYRQAALFWRRGLQHAPDDAEMRTFLENAESISRRLESIDATSR
ncbi:MAG: DUF4398 domain-containing protein [Nitrospirae bacterium]|nr:DUF4398 domain-containing protein [Nitrospirota bacterium]